MRIVPSNTPTLIRPEAATRGIPSAAADRDSGRWLEALKAIPDVRPEMVAEVEARIEAGELLTPAATLETAAALYNSPDG